MLAAMKEELRLRSQYLGQNPTIETLYFGGGTPSVFSPQEIQSLIEVVYDLFPDARNTIKEITLEANPEDLGREGTGWFLERCDVNRLSVGIQSFVERDLLLMGRNHAHTDMRALLTHYQQMGYDNISIDLIFGVPQLSQEEWLQNLRSAVECGIQHISLYALTVEPKTILAHKTRKGEIHIPSDEVFEQQYVSAHHFLRENGFEHYELSNYARAGFRSRHNSAYWNEVPYLGIGPSAHSFNGRERAWNVANNARYVKAIGEGELALETVEVREKVSHFNEYVMTHFRKAEGLDIAYVKQVWGWDLCEKYAEEIEYATQRGWMTVTPTHLQLTVEGWLVSDAVIVDFMVENEKR